MNVRRDPHREQAGQWAVDKVELRPNQRSRHAQGFSLAIDLEPFSQIDDLNQARSVRRDLRKRLVIAISDSGSETLVTLDQQFERALEGAKLGRAVEAYHGGDVVLAAALFDPLHE